MTSRRAAHRGYSRRRITPQGVSSIGGPDYWGRRNVGAVGVLDDDFDAAPSEDPIDITRTQGSIGNDLAQ